MKIVKETADIDDSSTEFVLLSFDHRGGGTAPTQRAAELHVRLSDLKRCVAARPQVPSKIKVNEVQSCCSLAFNAASFEFLNLNEFCWPLIAGGLKMRSSRSGRPASHRVIKRPH